MPVRPIELFISVYEQIMVEMVMENVVNVYLLIIIMLFGEMDGLAVHPGLIKIKGLKMLFTSTYLDG